MSLFDDTYKTISKPAEGTFRDKGSKFIAYAYPFRDESELKDLLASVKSQHPKARHWCYAYRLSPDRTVFRVNDDGEPSGSAGRPILNTLLSNDLTDVIVIVVRYFGGTLLGIPGLINAYKNATQEALDIAEIIEKTQEDVYRIDFDYLQMNDVMRIIKEDNLEILKQDFDNRCSITFSVRKSHLNQVVHKMESIENSKLIFCMPS